MSEEQRESSPTLPGHLPHPSEPGPAPGERELTDYQVPPAERDEPGAREEERKPS